MEATIEKVRNDRATEWPEAVSVEGPLALMDAVEDTKSTNGVRDLWVSELRSALQAADGQLSKVDAKLAQGDEYHERERKARALLNEAAVAVKTSVVPEHAPVRVEQVLSGADARTVEDVHTVAWRDLLAARRKLVRVDPDHYSHPGLVQKVTECEQVEATIDEVRSDRDMIDGDDIVDHHNEAARTLWKSLLRSASSSGHYDAREAKARTLLNQVAVAVKTAVVPEHAPMRVEQVLESVDAVSVEDVHTMAWRKLLGARRKLARVGPGLSLIHI